MKKFIYLVRHGESEANTNNIWGGDYPLSDKGRKEASSLLLPCQPERIISSTKQRAVQTAQIAFKQYEGECYTEFNEIDFGNLENTTPTSKNQEMANYNLQELLNIMNGDDLHKRATTMDKALKRIIFELQDNGAAAIICHDTLIRVWLQHIKRKDLSKARSENINLKNCDFFQVEYFQDLYNEPQLISIKHKKKEIYHNLH